LRRDRRWLLAALLAAASLTACAGGKNESGNKADEATGQAPEQKQPMDLVFYSSPGDFDEASFMARFGDKIHEKFP
jgi:ABC-type glycerol-3-phosphate transport system substrate-binding protein